MMIMTMLMTMLMIKFGARKGEMLANNSITLFQLLMKDRKLRWAR